MPLSSDELQAVNVSDTTDVPYMDSMDFSSTPRVQYLTEFPGIDSELFRRANGIADMPLWTYKGSARSADYYRRLQGDRRGAGREIIGVLSDGREWPATMAWREWWRSAGASVGSGTML